MQTLATDNFLLITMFVIATEKGKQNKFLKVVNKESPKVKTS